MNTKLNLPALSCTFSTSLDAELAISLVASFAYQRGCSIPKFETVKLSENLFKIVQILPVLPI